VEGSGKRRFRRTAARGRTGALIALLGGGLLVSAVAGAGESGPSAWEVLQERHPHQAERVPEAQRRILGQLTWQQLSAWLRGADPKGILLADGRTLAALLATNFDISWWTIDGGGGRMSGGAFTLDGTLGQADAAPLRTDPYALGGGYWPLDPLQLFRDGFEGGSESRWSTALGSAP